MDSVAEGSTDWCLSRQLGGPPGASVEGDVPCRVVEMGERGPGKTIRETVEQDFAGTDGPWIVAVAKRRQLSVLWKSSPILKNAKLVQDDDVLDTWFSSGLSAFCVGLAK